MGVVGYAVTMLGAYAFGREKRREREGTRPRERRGGGVDRGGEGTGRGTRTRGRWDGESRVETDV